MAQNLNNKSSSSSLSGGKSTGNASSSNNPHLYTLGIYRSVQSTHGVHVGRSCPNADHFALVLTDQTTTDCWKYHARGSNGVMSGTDVEKLPGFVPTQSSKRRGDLVVLVENDSKLSDAVVTSAMELVKNPPKPDGTPGDLRTFNTLVNNCQDFVIQILVVLVARGQLSHVALLKAMQVPRLRTLMPISYLPEIPTVHR